MNISKITSQTAKTYWVTIDDGEVRPHPYSRSDRQYRVRRIEVVKRDGNIASVVLSGPVLRKDGSDSLNESNERIYSHSDWPTWLRPIIGGLA